MEKPLDLDAVAMPLHRPEAHRAFGAGAACRGRGGASVFSAWGGVLPPFAHGDKGE